MAVASILLYWTVVAKVQQAPQPYCCLTEVTRLNILQSKEAGAVNKRSLDRGLVAAMTFRVCGLYVKTLASN